MRVAVPPSFARLHMVSKLAAFFERYPGIAVEFGTAETPTSLIEDGFDLAIHSGNLPDSSLVARRFAQTTIVLVCTPQYIEMFQAINARVLAAQEPRSPQNTTPT